MVLLIVMPRLKSSICNVIFMRMIFDLSEKKTFGTPTICLSLFVKEPRPSLDAGVFHPPQLNTATYCVGVLAVRMHFRVTHGTAGSTGISNRENIVNVPLMMCSLYFGFSLSQCCFF